MIIKFLHSKSLETKEEDGDVNNQLQDYVTKMLSDSPAHVAMEPPWS